MLVDTHIHLDAAEFDDDRDLLLTAARKAGVSRFVVPGVSCAGFAGLRELAGRHADVRLAFGIHPLYVATAQADDIEQVEATLLQGGALAVGEIGLDGFVGSPSLAEQEPWFVAQLRLAKRFGLPVLLHVRRAVDQVLKNLRRVEVPGGIAHAFNGSEQQARQFIDMGFKLGFGGAMTYSGSTRIRHLAASLPLESLVLETDAPDISPQWAAGGRNEPVNLARFATVLAQLRNDSLENICSQTSRNAQVVLPGL